MPARRKRSRKRSSGKRRRKLPPLFLDEGLQSLKLAGALKKAGFNVRMHSDHFAPGTPDTTWLREVGRRKWLALTRDQRIRQRIIEREAVTQAGVGLFILCGKKDMKADGIADVLKKAATRISNFIAKHKPPYIVKITGAGALSVSWMPNSGLGKP